MEEMEIMATAIGPFRTEDDALAAATVEVERMTALGYRVEHIETVPNELDPRTIDVVIYYMERERPIAVEKPVPTKRKIPTGLFLIGIFTGIVALGAAVYATREKKEKQS